MAAFKFIDQREKTRLFVNERSKERKEKAKERYDRGVQSHENPYQPGDLVMLYDDAVAKKKLHESYRGPFRVIGFGSDRAHSYSLEQLNGTKIKRTFHGTKIKRTFHGDQLRLFVLRTGHLVTSEEVVLPLYQSIRAPRHKAKTIALGTSE
ncbi:hypothetical protein K3495_g14858 [Podosphaera aphanis]|nr:hypothetical protein K3495_g14858 [Podosphaera aphanis]